MEDRNNPSRNKRIPFSEFRSAVEELWVVLYRAHEEGRLWHPPLDTRWRWIYEGDLTPAQADIVLWEKTHRQRHPYRGMIEGIPARGLD
jgi:hypothetical protein